jgi:hypothetical protein
MDPFLTSGTTVGNHVQSKEITIKNSHILNCVEDSHLMHYIPLHRAD